MIAQPPYSLPFSIVYGSLSFGVVSVIAYSLWAFHLIPNEAVLYAATALVYIGLAGLALSRLVSASEGARKRFPLLFAIAFLLYAIGWCALWFGLRGKFHADLWGATVGLAAMAWYLRRACHSETAFLLVFAVLFTFHSLGYYLGDILYACVNGTPGPTSVGRGSRPRLRRGPWASPSSMSQAFGRHAAESPLNERHH